MVPLITIITCVFFYYYYLELTSLIFPTKFYGEKKLYKIIILGIIQTEM